MLSLAEIKRGKVIVLNGEPYQVVDNVFGKQARGGGVMKTKVKNLLSGKVRSYTFKGNDQAEEADVSYHHCQYLYESDGELHFMNNQTFDQFTLPSEQLGPSVQFMVEGSEVDVMYFNDKPVGINLPAKVELKVVEAPPGIKGDTATGATKQIKMETGYTLNVPLFINEGDIIRINTDTGEYVERV
ncbi:MAG: elongation factor P [Candidatus Abawacabacteria bacterium RIFCSPHIGHO2_01_FULL_46_8]|uniref:Elongation factor P n=1 Tax=Candidatus Abawacabacteria bacterium RIFCSPHIGHO2_01_FULL_46_8 TaxID=1817815 RepID=A0A1F4XJE0_9BACT|nr:MAG: elongation factor P [Candidatus Abawacabacteria bacterium RIFCSPHIGHO2_01_FULL_46_8]